MYKRTSAIWLLVLCLAVSVGLTSMAYGQNGQKTAANPRPSVEAGQVCPQLATLVIRLQKSAYKQHDLITVELVLRAGGKGVYLPNYFGDFMATCTNGFSANLFTQDGKLAGDGRGCGGSVGHSTDDTALGELHNFVHLAPGKTRIWHTALATAGLPPGRYQVVAEYLSSAYMIDKVAHLPQVEGLMAQGRITAPPVIVTIR